MTVTADWQAELAGVTIGAGTRYVFTGPISGLGIPGPRTADFERGDQPGNVAGIDVAARRILTVPVGIDGDGPDHAWGLLAALTAAWAPVSADVPFDLRLPGFGATRRFYGRPRGVDTDLTLLRVGWLDALATFEALDPNSYGSEIVLSLTGGTAPVTGGTAPSDRWRATIDIDLPPAVLTAAGNDEPPLTLDTTGVVVVDGRARTVTTVGGVDRYAAVTAGSGWPLLRPGATTVTLTGGTGTLTYRPAYQ